MNASTLILFSIISLSFGTPTVSENPSNQFTVESWNVESLSHDPHMPALYIAETHGVDLWGLCGVRHEWWAGLFRDAATENRQRGMTAILSPTRGTDRQLILYDPNRFELIRTSEVGWSGAPWYRPGMCLRPALVAQFRHIPTGLEFLFMVNCLDPRYAALQADKIARWARGQTLPIIAVGTYYFQYNLGSQPLRCDGQAGLSILQASGALHWVRPEDLVKTFDSRLDTIEDFVFLGNAAGRLTARSRIVVGLSDFSNRQPTGAHRPIRTTFTVLAGTSEAQLRRQIAEQARRVKEDLDKLEDLVRQLPE